MSRYYDDDDEFDIKILEGSIEDAEELLARFDNFFVKSPYDIFAKNDLYARYEDEFSYLIFDDINSAIMFHFSNDFVRNGKGECNISIIDNRSRLGLSLQFVSKTNYGNTAFTLVLQKNGNSLVEFLSGCGNGGCTISEFLSELAEMGISFPNNFVDHLCNFINNCINTYNSLLEQGKVIKDDEEE